MSADNFSHRDIEFHRATAATYDEETTAVFSVYHRYLVDPYLDRLAQTMPGGRALDLGCGTGVLSLALALRGIFVLGIDHSADMLAVARAKIIASGLEDSVELVTGDVRHVAAADDEFDYVTCQGLLHHLTEMEMTLRELHRVLRPGGHFFISEPSSCKTPASRVLAFLGRRLRRGRAPQFPCGAESLEAPIDPRDLTLLLDQLGLEYELRFLVHLGPLRRLLPEWAYVLAVRAFSFPWRRSCGDLMFVFGRKPVHAE